MKRSFLAAVVSLLVLAACSSDPGDSTPIAQGPQAAAGGGSGSRATCSAEATTRFRGKLMAVRLRISPCRVKAGEAPKAVMRNTGDGELGYGFPFKLERKEDEGWRWINRRQAFILPLLYLAPGERSDPESLAVYFGKPQPLELRPGLYRVTKSVDLTLGKPRPPTLEVKATFRVD